MKIYLEVEDLPNGKIKIGCSVSETWLELNYTNPFDAKGVTRNMIKEAKRLALESLPHLHKFVPGVNIDGK